MVEFKVSIELLIIYCIVYCKQMNVKQKKINKNRNKYRIKIVYKGGC